MENVKGLFFDVGGTVFEWKNAAREKIQKLVDCARKDLPEVIELCPDPMPLKYECSI